MAPAKLAVWKFASCDGCQLTLLDCEDELLALTERVHIAHFLEASSTIEDGPYDVSLVEGSITTPDDVERIHRIREHSRILVTIGACANAGGIQALRNFADLAEFRSVVYAQPDYVQALAQSTPIAAHVPVDVELQGCPIDRHQLLETITALLTGRRPPVPSATVCQECKLRGTACLVVTKGTTCLGPVTRAGCGALCPAFDRGCFGCFGPVDAPNTSAMVSALRSLGLPAADAVHVFRTFNTANPSFQRAAEEVEAS